ncbi:MAG: peptide deformylase [Oscillospiraceae bacterium]|nr:peptide deformylase [Oscillospiraceae bacterium]
MIKDLIHDESFLAQKSRVATKDDLDIAQNLLDTLIAHKDECVGMAGNMIGERKRIIAFLDQSAIAPTYTVMLNPQIIKKSDMYETREGCLSLLGEPRPCKRYKTITVQYQDLELNSFEKTYTGFTAQIIQHEVDHINGVLI